MSFISLSCLIPLDRTSNMLNSSGKNGHHHYHVEYVHFYSWQLSKSFYEDVGFCEMTFVHQLRWTCVFFPLDSTNVMCYIDFFLTLNHPRNSEINLTFLWCKRLFIWFWVWFTSILMRMYASIFIRNISLSFSFFVSFLMWF